MRNRDGVRILERRPFAERKATLSAWIHGTYTLVSCTLFVVATLGVLFGQEVEAPAGKAAGVFDDDGKTAEPKPGGTAKAPAVTDRDSIGFTQENVAAQMTELEERMFRLSEALRSLEPENASRLSLALRFSREELILHQMKDTQKLLKDAQLSKAETEVRELLAKLEHLRSLLLAEDLDFQMKLARLRQMRETLGQLERIIKEEQRELTWSRATVNHQAELAQVRSRKGDLETLVREQRDVVRNTRDALPNAGEKASKEAREANLERESDVRKTAAKLSTDPLFASLRPPFLKQATSHLDDVIASLENTVSADTVAEEEKALELFQKELDRLTDRAAKAEQAIAPEQFRRFEQDQGRNRAATDTLGEVSARLGDSGIALRKDLIRAGGSMRAAEGDLAKTAAEPAAEDQFDALKHLVKSRDELARDIEKLLVQLRSELQARILAELTEMHETQVSIRETTEAQAPRVAQRSRTALLSVVGLAKQEAELAERTEHLGLLTAEIEFGIALPTALHVLGREMSKIQDWLKQGDASARTVTLEKRVEQDLLALLEAMRRLPPTSPPPPGTPLPNDLRARERELNRLIAELKMIRLLQSRLNDDTIEVDHGRPENAVLTPALRREIDGLKGGQDEIRDSLAKIARRLEPPQEPAPPRDPTMSDFLKTRIPIGQGRDGSAK